MILVKMNGEVYAVNHGIRQGDWRADEPSRLEVALCNIATGAVTAVCALEATDDGMPTLGEALTSAFSTLRMAGAEVFGWDDEPAMSPPASIASHLEGWRKFNADVAKLSEDAKYENHPECPHCGKDDRDWADGYLPVAGVIECEGCGQEYAYSTKVCLEFETSEVDGNEEE